MAKIKDEFLRLNVVINGIAGASRQFLGLKKDLDLNGKSLKELRKDLKLAKIAISNAVPGTENFKRLQKEIKATSARIKELQTGASGVKKLFSGWGIALTASFAIVSKGIQALASKIGDFEQANVNLATVLGKNVSEIGELTRSAKQLGATTQYTASEVTSLQMELAKLGFTESQIKGMSKATLDFATAVGTDLASAAQLAGATLRIFDLRADQSDEALGILAVATNKSALNFSFLQTAMSTVGPVAKTFGFSLRDTTTLLGALANAGFDASSAATATRNILLNLANANGKLAKAIGGPVKDFSGLMDAFESLKKKGIDLAGALELTDKRSVSAFSSFLDGTDAARKLHESLGDVEGDLGRIADERMNTLNGSILKLKSAWEGFVLSLDSSKGILKWAVDRLTDIVTLARKLMTSKSDKIEERIDSTVEDFVKKGTSDEEIIREIDNKRGAREGFQDAIKKEFQEHPFGSAAVDLYGKRMHQLDTEIFILEEAQMRLAKMRRESGTPPPPLDGGDGGDGGGTNKKQWSLQSDEAYLIAKAELTRKYNEGEIATAAEFNEQLYRAEISAYSARLASHKDAEADRLKIEADMQAAIKKHKDEGLKKEKEIAEAAKKIQDELDDYAKTASQKKLAEEERRYKKERAQYQNNAKLLELIDKNHKNREKLIALDAINEALALSKSKYENERKALENHWDTLILKNRKGSSEELRLKRQKTKELAELDLAYLKALQDDLTKIVNSGIMAGVKLTDQQLENLKKQLADIAALINKANESIHKKSIKEGAGGGTFFGVSQEEWDSLFEHLEKGIFMASDLRTLAKAVGGAANEAFNIASKSFELMAAKEKKEFQDYKKANEEKQRLLEGRLSSGLISQTQYNAEVEALEKERQEKEEEMAIKQAEREKGMNIAKAIINTAVGITTTLATFGATIPGLAMAAVMAAIGATEIGLIAAQPVTGAEDGGLVNIEREQDGKPFKARLNPNKRGYVNGPTVLVGEAGGEYVVPASGLNNPTLAPILGTIESARKAGTLRNLDFSTLYHPSSASGFADGGFTQAIQEAGLMTVSKADLAEIIVWLKSVRAKMNDPVPAQLSYFGRGGLKETMDKYDRARANGVLK